MSSSDRATAAFPTATELVDRVPLIKNPAFWVPRPVQVPPDVHPLPDDVQAYFVYPHTLEQHVLSTLPLELADMRRKQVEREALLESYSESKERARKAKLQAIAPGWNEGIGGVMQPLRKTTTTTTTTTITVGSDERNPGDGSLRKSPTELDDADSDRADKLERDQMQDWLDKWDGGDKSGAQVVQPRVDNLI